jgi:hypothetical protein
MRVSGLLTILASALTASAFALPVAHSLEVRAPNKFNPEEASMLINKTQDAYRELRSFRNNYADLVVNTIRTWSGAPRKGMKRMVTDFHRRVKRGEDALSLISAVLASYI